MATSSEKRRAALSIALNGLFIAAVVIAIGVAVGFLVRSAIVGAALPVLVITGLLAYVAWKLPKRR